MTDPPPSPQPDQHLEERCLAVVLPCRDDADRVKRSLERILASPYVAELVVVDDGSTDGTPDVIRHVDDPRVRLIELGMPFGKGAAVRRGFAEAQAPIVMVQDVLVDYDPAEYDRVLRPILEDRADVVYGSRFTSQPHRVLSYRNAIGNRILTLASNACTNLNLTDVATGLKAFRREVVVDLDLDQDRYGIEPELTAKVALARRRVWEVGVSYAGRAQLEPVGVRLVDGVRSLWSVARYSRTGMRLTKPRWVAEQGVGLAGFDEADEHLAATLDSLDGVGNYADWIVEMIAPHVGGDIIEIGAGHGTIADRLRRLGRLTAVEPSPRAAATLRRRFGHDVEVVEARAEDVMADQRFDAAVMVNVLEHIDDDVGTLRAIRAGLRPGGTIAVWVPAHEFLYSRFDRAIGHRRRYRRSTLAEALSRAGFELVDLRYVNGPGAVAWWLTSRVLRQPPTRRSTARVYDTLVVPVLRPLERRFRPPFGQSLLAIARTTPDGE